ncbi:hypothetical protein FB451DRAFT_1193905 [Mycena latifolia]|nr:hypothetical protein FB451DRAFT_1193905 [Mycena latifolia]
MLPTAQKLLLLMLDLLLQPLSEQHPYRDLFADSFQYEDRFFDASGAQILFSAGADLDGPRLTEQAKIWQQIDRVALLQDHSLFGQFSDDVQDDPDSVDGAFSAALSRMGIQDDDSDREDEEDDFGSMRVVDEEEAWFFEGPYWTKHSFVQCPGGFARDLARSCKILKDLARF